MGREYWVASHVGDNYNLDPGIQAESPEAALATVKGRRPTWPDGAEFEVLSPLVQEIIFRQQSAIMQLRLEIDQREKHFADLNSKLARAREEARPR